MLQPTTTVYLLYRELYTPNGFKGYRFLQKIACQRPVWSFCVVLSLARIASVPISMTKPHRCHVKNDVIIHKTQQKPEDGQSGGRGSQRSN